MSTLKIMYKTSLYMILKYTEFAYFEITSTLED
jgi:hypothetical protein